MKIKWILTSLTALMFGLAVFTMTGCNKSEHEQGTVEAPGHEPSTTTKYACPMHPEVAQADPKAFKPLADGNLNHTQPPI